MGAVTDIFVDCGCNGFKYNDNIPNVGAKNFSPLLALTGSMKIVVNNMARTSVFMFSPPPPQ